MKSTLTVLCLSLLIAGCNGQNPFKRQSNPVKDYPSASDRSGVPYVPGQKQEVPEPEMPDEKMCVTPMHVALNPDHGNLVALFTEGVESRYKIVVTNRTGVGYKIQASTNTDGKLNLVEENDRETVYEFIWTPGTSYDPVSALRFTHMFTSEKTRTYCGDGTTTVNLVVQKSLGHPSLSIVGLPESVTFGDEPVAFQIEVNDPTSTPASAPTLKLGFNKQAGAVIDASKNSAADCDENDAVNIEGTRWTFNCTFTSSALSGVKNFVGSGRTLDAVFYAIAASSTAPELKSTPTPATTKVLFPEIEKAPPEFGPDQGD